jgi:hypothetical protein
MLISLYVTVIFTACTSPKEEKTEEGNFTITSPL